MLEQLHASDVSLMLRINREWAGPWLDHLLPTVSSFAAWLPLMLVVIAICVWRGGFHTRAFVACLVLAVLACLRTDPGVELVFSDVKMPGEMDGLALAERLRTDYPHIRVVLASGHLVEAALGEGLTLIAKPYPIEQTIARLVALLQERRAAR